MAALDSRDGRSDLQFGKDQGQDDAPASHVTYRTEDDETRSGPTMMQKLKERVSDYGNHLKGKESSEKEDPHPELAYIPPGDAKGEAAEEGKHHGGVPTAALGNPKPAEVTTDNNVKNDKDGGLRKDFSGEGADAPTTVEKIKEKFWEAENHMKGKETSAVEDPHPELSYITPMPQEEKPGFFSRMGQKFGGQENKAAAVPKGTGSSEVGTGYEEDGEETLNPDVVPKYDEGVKPQP